MRLIDAEALKKTFCAECNHTILCEDCDIDFHFEHLAPTVEAIPIEWLKRFKAGEYRDSYWSWFTDRLIEMWREEKDNE